MKFTSSTAIWAVYGLSLLAIAFGCQNQNAGPLVPNRFNQLTELKLPNTLISSPASASVVLSSVTSATLANSLNAGITAIPLSPQTPSVVTRAVTDMTSALAATGNSASALVANFTPQVVATLASQGTLPGLLQVTVNNIGANQTVRPYLPVVVLPKLNGQEIVSTTSAIILPNSVPYSIQPLSSSSVIQEARVKPYAYPGNDVIFDEATRLFSLTIQNLEINRLRQISDVNAAYTVVKTASDNELPSCRSTNSSKYNSLIASSLQSLNTNLGNLNVVKSALSESAYTTLVALTYVQYSYQMQAYFQLQAADFNVCRINSDVKARYAAIARDTDMNTINSAFNSTVTTARNYLAEALSKSTENQGGGQ